MLGWGVPMPIPIRSRRYDQQFWIDIFGEERKPKTKEEILKALGMSNDPD